MISLGATAALTALADEPTELTSEKDKVSYALGMMAGRDFKNQSMDIDPDLFVKGLRDSLGDGPTLLTEIEARDAFTGFRRQLMQQQAERMKELAEKNRQEGEAFLTSNRAVEGVTALPSGLQYKVLQEGTGKQPDPQDTVTVHYTGKLLDDTVFDSSVERGQPVTFALSGVIPGWREGVALMKEGAKYRLFIPPDLAYGQRGSPPRIGPQATLVFDVELIAVVKSEQE
jgi:FKBP-type peptidyl-prolyl cis-trans isomerase FklB